MQRKINIITQSKKQHDIKQLLDKKRNNPQHICSENKNINNNYYIQKTIKQKNTQDNNIVTIYAAKINKKSNKT